MIIQAPVTLTPEEQDFIETKVMSDMFPWYRTDYQLFDSVVAEAQGQPPIQTPIDPPGLVLDLPLMTHMLLKTPPEETEESRVNSPNWPFFLTIFDRWMKEQGLEYKRIYRGALNTVFPSHADYGLPHVDHHWPHSNWIMYLNTIPDAPTVLMDDTYSIHTEIACEKYTAASFSQQLHTHRYSRGTHARMIVIITWA